MYNNRIGVVVWLLNEDLITKNLDTGSMDNGYISENYELYKNEKLIKKVYTKIFKNGDYVSSTYDYLDNELIVVSNYGINKFRINYINDNIEVEKQTYSYKNLF